jgi:hypothetical protein
LLLIFKPGFAPTMPARAIASIAGQSFLSASSHVALRCRFFLKHVAALHPAIPRGLAGNLKQWFDTDVGMSAWKCA